MYQYAFKSVFRRKKREKLGYFETLCTRVEERGTRFVRGEIGLVKEFISLFSSNLLRIIKNEVKFIVKSIISFTQRGVGCCSSSVMKIDSRIHKTFLTRSTFRPLYPQPYGLRVVRQLRTRYAALKALRDFFLMPLLPSNRLVLNKRRRWFESIENIILCVFKWDEIASFLDKSFQGRFRTTRVAIELFHKLIQSFRREREREKKGKIRSTSSKPPPTNHSTSFLRFIPYDIRSYNR